MTVLKHFLDPEVPKEQWEQCQSTDFELNF